MAASAASADPQLSPITDRDYAIELYDSTALGNTAVVGMGGAALALASGTSGTLNNPAAPAVRSTTDTDSWSWDYHIDYLIGSLSSDYDNNGLTTQNGGLKRDDGGTSVVTGGVGIRYHDWAIAMTATEQFALVDAMVATQSNVSLRASALRFQLALAKWVPQLDTAIGVSVTNAQFELKPNCTTAGCQSLFTISGPGFEAGATWIPRRESLRVAAAVSSAIAGGSVVASSCPDLANCDGFILPSTVVSPWRIAGGGAYRWAETAWNQQVGGWFRDEPSLTLAADLVVAGPSENAFGLEAFGTKQLQRAGLHATYSVRAGAEYEWVPGRFRVRAGSYWEPSRFEGISGRIHGTFGVEVRVLQFWLWGSLRRGRISLTADLASQYRNIGLSIGFWH
ncbi:MAG: hypothetical protein JWO36_6846 [Myxococcales bacterium]|nr:hypothetical protein [Myxococcales bacterium]